MMNIELLFRAAQNGSDPEQNQQWYQMAVSHAGVTMANHVRADGSTHQLIDFDPTTGDPIGPGAVQGVSVDSTWSRGQAWGLYGFTMTYRETITEKGTSLIVLRLPRPAGAAQGELEAQPVAGPSDSD